MLNGYCTPRSHLRMLTPPFLYRTLFRKAKDLSRIPKERAHVVRICECFECFLVKNLNLFVLHLHLVRTPVLADGARGRKCSVIRVTGARCLGIRD